MASLWKNDKNFKIIQMSWREYVVASESWGLCDICASNTSDDPIYYIAVLDQWYCKKCLDAYLSGAKKYKSDIEKEQMNFIKVKHRLEDFGCWENV